MTRDEIIQYQRSLAADADLIKRARVLLAGALPSACDGCVDWHKMCAALLRALDKERAERKQDWKDFQADIRDAAAQARADGREEASDYGGFHSFL